MDIEYIKKLKELKDELEIPNDEFKLLLLIAFNYQKRIIYCSLFVQFMILYKLVITDKTC